VSAKSAQIPLTFDHRPALGGDDFLVAPCNADPVAWIDKWPDWQGPALAVAGPSGCGKTHLVSVFAARSGARIVGPDALAGGEPPETAGAPLAIDDAEAAMGDAAAERALFHLFNRAVTDPGQLLITGTRPPARWAVGLADLRSRLAALPVAEIKTPDDTLLAALLVKLFADRQINVSTEVVHYLAGRMERSFAATHALVAEIDRLALAERRAVTIPLVRPLVEERG
jgi:chromosomal replication initiation ATPase DnaA